LAGAEVPDSDARVSAGSVRHDVLGDVLGVPSDAADQRRGQRVLKGQADEVQSGLGTHDATFVYRLSGVADDGEFDPPEIGPEPGARSAADNCAKASPQACRSNESRPRARSSAVAM
jgi:hypothetical protein